MDSSPSQQRGSGFVSNSQGFAHECESNTFSITEEQGAVGGVHTVRHNHHHYHHHYVRQIQQSSSCNQSRESERASRPGFTYSSNPSPPSYEEAVSGIAATSSPLQQRSDPRDIGVAPEPNSAWSFPTCPRSDAWEEVDISLPSQSDDSGSEGDFQIDPIVFDQLSPRASPVATESEGGHSAEDFLSEASISPPVSQLSMRSDSTSSTDVDQRECVEGAAIADSRLAVRRVLLEIVAHLQRRQNWCSADAAWDYLVERLCGHGRAAQREAEVLWEFAFQAQPLEHFGAVLRLPID